MQVFTSSPSSSLLLLALQSASNAMRLYSLIAELCLLLSVLTAAANALPREAPTSTKARRYVGGHSQLQAPGQAIRAPWAAPAQPVEQLSLAARDRIRAAQKSRHSLSKRDSCPAWVISSVRSCHAKVLTYNRLTPTRPATKSGTTCPQGCPSLCPSDGGESST